LQVYDGGLGLSTLGCAQVADTASPARSLSPRVAFHRRANYTARAGCLEPRLMHTTVDFPNLASAGRGDSGLP